MGKALVRQVRDLAIASPVDLKDFADLEGLPREQQARRWRELDERGQTIAAVYMAKGLQGCDLSKATDFGKGLRGGPHS
jgi:hypothetical protein